MRVCLGLTANSQVLRVLAKRRQRTIIKNDIRNTESWWKQFWFDGK